VLLLILAQTSDTSHTRPSYPGMPKPMACTSLCLLLSPAVVVTLRFTRTGKPLLPAVASQLRRHIHDVIMAGDGPSVLLTSEHVIPVLIEHKILASTLRACDSMSTHKWDGRSERLTEKNTQISQVKRVGLAVSGGEREIFITRQPPIGGKDHCDSENSWISEGLPSSSRRRSREEGGGGGGGGEGREKVSASKVDVGVDGAESEIKVERRRVPE